MDQDSTGTLQSAFDRWEDIPRERKLLIYVLIVSAAISVVVVDFLSDFDATFWVGISVYGILNMVFGDLGVLESKHIDGTTVLFGVKLDSVIGAQLLAGSLAVVTVFLGRVLRQLAEKSVGVFSEVQALGVFILVSRLAIIIVNEESLGYGRWSKSVSALGAGLILLPFIVGFFPVPSGIETTVKILVPVGVSGTVLLIEEGELDLDDLF